jgi:hypothetical protein
MKDRGIRPKTAQNTAESVKNSVPIPLVVSLADDCRSMTND